MQRTRDRIGDGHTAARQREHDDIASPRVFAQSTGQLAAGIGAIGKTLEHDRLPAVAPDAKPASAPVNEHGSSAAPMQAGSHRHARRRRKGSEAAGLPVQPPERLCIGLRKLGRTLEHVYRFRMRGRAFGQRGQRDAVVDDHEARRGIAVPGIDRHVDTGRFQIARAAVPAARGERTSTTRTSTPRAPRAARSRPPAARACSRPAVRGAAPARSGRRSRRPPHCHTKVCADRCGIGRNLGGVGARRATKRGEGRRLVSWRAPL